jgi:hypothetical protein
MLMCLSELAETSTFTYDIDLQSQRPFPRKANRLIEICDRSSCHSIAAPPDMCILTSSMTQPSRSGQMSLSWLWWIYTGP